MEVNDVKRMMSIDAEVLEELLFQVYFRGNISTENAAKLLEIPVAEFIEIYDKWNGEE